MGKWLGRWESAGFLTFETGPRASTRVQLLRECWGGKLWNALTTLEVVEDEEERIAS